MTDPENRSKGDRKGLNRRRFMAFMAGCSAAGLGGLNARCSPGDKEGKPAPDEPAPPFVVRLERPQILEPGRDFSEEAAKRQMEALLQALAGERSISSFLKSLFQPGHRIGIKLNCLAGKGLSPTPALVHALVDLLEKADFSPDQVILFERTERELRKAGFPIRHGSGLRVMGNDSPGAGYDREPTCFGSIGSCFSRILTQQIDGLINFGVVKDHDLAGVSAGLKNLYGLIHNPNKYHDNHCSPYVAHVAASPPVKGKLKLTLCDGLIAQYHGGPALKKSCTWKAGILLASRDPVALDAVAASIIEDKRRAVGMKPLAETDQAPYFLEEARKLGLGEDRLDRIEIKKIT
jgi:uncharacterized protein (DUF362 family)